MKDAQFNKLFLFTCSLVPAVMIAIDFCDGRTTDSAGLLRNTGICSLIFLALSLAVTPLRRITGKNHWSLYRRMLGLYAFFYALLHVGIYIFIRNGNHWNAIWLDIVGGFSVNFDSLKRGFAGGKPLGNIVYDVLSKNYVILGMLAFLIMVPLAATSTVWAIKKMGNKQWKFLHKLVYISAVAAAVHYLLTPKQITDQKIIFAAIFALLLLFRVAAWARDKWFRPAKPARPASTGTPLPSQP